MHLALLHTEKFRKSKVISAQTKLTDCSEIKIAEVLEATLCPQTSFTLLEVGSISVGKTVEYVT